MIDAVWKEAKGKLGIAVITSDGPFMAVKDIFTNNKFKIVEEEGKHQLLVKQLKKGQLPKFRDYRNKLDIFKGWHIVYTNQCPWITRFINELDKQTIDKLNLKLTEMKTPKQAQDAPSIYSVFNLIHNGKVLADHYISRTRFNNIIKKEL